MRISHGHPMHLYFVPNDPERTTLVSSTGDALYQIVTSSPLPFAGPPVSRIKRPADCEADSIVAEIEWRRWGAHPIVRSSVFNGAVKVLQVRQLLFKQSKMSRFSAYAPHAPRTPGGH